MCSNIDVVHLMRQSFRLGYAAAKAGAVLDLDKALPANVVPIKRRRKRQGGSDAQDIGSGGITAGGGV